MLRAVTRSYGFTLAGALALMREHRRLIRLIKAGDADGAAALAEQHVEGAGRRVLEQLRGSRAAIAGSRSFRCQGLPRTRLSCENLRDLARAEPKVFRRFLSRAEGDSRRAPSEGSHRPSSPLAGRKRNKV